MPRKSESEMFPIIEEWESSPESMGQFCERHQIPKSTFSYWRTRYSKNNQKSRVNRAEFLEVRMDHVSVDLEIIYPNGVKLRLPQNSPMSQLRTLIQLV